MSSTPTRPALLESRPLNPESMVLALIRSLLLSSKLLIYNHVTISSTISTPLVILVGNLILFHGNNYCNLKTFFTSFDRLGEKIALDQLIFQASNR